MKKLVSNRDEKVIGKQVVRQWIEMRRAVKEEGSGVDGGAEGHTPHNASRGKD